MNPTNPKVTDRHGPHLSAAFFCEKVILDDRDGSPSAIRIVDRIDVALSADTPADFPSEQNRLPVSITGLVSFRSGDSPGKHTVRIGLVSPSGKSNPKTYEQEMTFPDTPYAGVNVRLETTILLKSSSGLFWMQVFLDEEFVTQVPLWIQVQRVDARPIAAAEERD